MAALSGLVGQRTAFAGGDDTIKFDLNSLNRNGFQISSEGFDVEGATVSVVAVGTTESTVVEAPDGSGKAAFFCEGFRCESVTIGGLTAGSYFVTVLE
jgi:hypothetical protein